MKKLFSSLAILCSAVVFAQEKTVINDRNAEPRSVKSFHAIKVTDGIGLYLSQGDEAAAVSASQASYRDKIKTEVENGVLKIWYDNGTFSHFIFSNHRNLRVYVSYKELDRIDASAGSDVLVDGTMKAKSLSLKLSSGSDFKGNVNVGAITVDQSSGSDVKIGGKVDTLSIEANSGSDFNGYSLVAEVCTAKGSSGSTINVYVNKELNARASSGGDIHYKGSPSLRSSSASGGNVRKHS